MSNLSSPAAAVGRSSPPANGGRGWVEHGLTFAAPSLRCRISSGVAERGGERAALAVPVLGDGTGRASGRLSERGTGRPEARRPHGPRRVLPLLHPHPSQTHPIPVTAGRPLLHNRPRPSYQIRRGRVRGWSPTYSLLRALAALCPYRKVAYLFASPALLYHTGWSPTYSKVAQVFGEGRLLIRGQLGAARAECGQVSPEVYDTSETDDGGGERRSVLAPEHPVHLVQEEPVNPQRQYGSCAASRSEAAPRRGWAVR